MTNEKYRNALAWVIELAKCHRDLSDSPFDARRWENVVVQCLKTLGNPCAADLIEGAQEYVKETEA